MRTGIAQTPLHGGHCPPWLFEKMKQLSAAIVQVIVLEYGQAELLRRLADPVWFQAFGSVLGFDWHSSGLTTVVCGALKEGLRDLQGELGVFFCGGKGKTSRKTPQEIVEAGETHGLSNDLQELQRTSRLVAKVDSAAVQDGYELYHHFFVFDRQGNWAVVQQGMNRENLYARRYHWLSETVTNYVEEPHAAVCGLRERHVLNLVSRENGAARLAAVELCREKPEKVRKWFEAAADRSFTWLQMPASHPIPAARYLDKILHQIYRQPPEHFVGLLETRGVGASTLRALTMVAEVTHGVRPSFHDPVRYAFAHGGKDGFPFPVRRADMERSIGVLRRAVEQARLGNREKLESLRRLAVQEKRLVAATGGQ